jgi:hypothetical protein
LIQRIDKQKCPVCGLEIEEVWKTDFSDVFIAKDGLEGLTVWAAYGAPKRVSCQRDNVVHVYYPGNNTHKLVYIRCELPPEPEIEIDENAVCQVEGCENKAIPCFIRWFNEDAGRYQTDVDYFCQEHCFEHGYCYACGRFWGGVEDFDFSTTKMCPECEEAQERNRCPKTGKQAEQKDCESCEFADVIDAGALLVVLCKHPEYDG